MSTPVSNNGSDSDGSATRKRVFSIPLEEEIEPYVRRRRISSERNRKRLEKLSEEEQNLLRTSINSRERRRMHDLNDALDELRTVLPYSHGASARRLSKINTIILASNCIRNLNKRFTDISAENQQLRAMIPEDKLSTIKSIELPPIQLATTIDTDFSPTLMPPAKSRRLSGSPVDHQKIDLPANVNSKKASENKPSPSSQQQQPSAPSTNIEPVFPMALLAAAAFNLHGQPGALQTQSPMHQFPTFGHPSPHFCMKRFNPAAFCACVGCFMQNASLNAALVSRTVKPNSNR